MGDRRSLLQFGAVWLYLLVDAALRVACVVLSFLVLSNPTLSGHWWVWVVGVVFFAALVVCTRLTQWKALGYSGAAGVRNALISAFFSTLTHS